jgi:hypothetical protein
MDPFFYTPEEIALAEDITPTKGEFCPVCKTYIPYVLGMTPEVAAQIRVHLSGEQSSVARYALRKLFGFPLGWVKIWWIHRDGLHEPPPETPCPYCSLPLRTPYAKQCRHCRKDWHDLNNIKFLGD